MATGLYLTPDGMVIVDYGRRKIPIPPAQYRANGYRPPFDTLRRNDMPAERIAAGPRVPGRSEPFGKPPRP